MRISDWSSDVCSSDLEAQRAQQAVLFVEATSASAMLASAISSSHGEVALPVVVNDHTTVATGNAFAQFISASGIAGDAVGMRNEIGRASCRERVSQYV